jgi:hypothetical protein
MAGGDQVLVDELAPDAVWMPDTFQVVFRILAGGVAAQHAVKENKRKDPHVRCAVDVHGLVSQRVHNICKTFKIYGAGDSKFTGMWI